MLIIVAPTRKSFASFVPPEKIPPSLSSRFPSLSPVDSLLKTYTKICERVSNLMNIKFASEPVYGDNDKYIKAKIKTYGDNVDTNFQGNIIPKENT